MTRKLWLAVWLICAGSATSYVRADSCGLLGWRGPHFWCEMWRPCQTRCPNDYCSKPLPLACPEAICNANDYCSKPLPLPVPPRSPCAWCDDYCPKNGFIRVRIGNGPWYQCGSCLPCSTVKTGN